MIPSPLLRKGAPMSRWLLSVCAALMLGGAAPSLDRIDE
jgi:hypothetical protein